MKTIYNKKKIKQYFYNIKELYNQLKKSKHIFILENDDLKLIIKRK